VDRVRSDSAPNIHQDPKESSPKPLEHNRFNGGGGAPTGEQPIPGAGTNYNPKDDVGPKTPIEEQTAPIVPPLQVAAVDSIRPTAWKWLVILFLLILLLIGLIYRFIAGGQNPAERELRNEILALSTKIQEKLAECGAGSDSAGGQPSAGDAALSQDEMKRRQVDNNVGSSGRVNVALAWGSKVDLDLVVMQPDGSFVYFGRCDGKLCGSLDVDANFCSSGASCPGLTDKPLENISWNERMQPGIYTVLVNLYSTHSTMKPRAPIPYTIELRVGGEIKTFAGRIAPESVSCSDRCSAKLIQVTQFKID
jgi:hypothetical protein